MERKDIISQFSIFVITLTFMIMTSCHSDHKLNPNVFKYNQATGINSLDPAFTKEQASIWACTNLYDGLMILDPSSQLQLHLADSVHLSEDRRTYRFSIKKGIFFHPNTCFGKSQTRALNAYDVLYSFQRILDPKVASPGAWIFRDKVDSIEPFKVIDSFTFQIRLARPYVQFLYILSMPYCSIVPQEAITYYGKDFGRHPVGTGPFMFKIWEEGNALFFERNPNYFMKDTNGQRLPYLSHVKISFLEQKKMEFLAFQKGELDMISGIDQSYLQDVFAPDGTVLPVWKDKMKVYKAPYLNTEFLAILMKKNGGKSIEPLQNQSIRQAINYAVDRQEIVSALKYNLVKPANKSIVPFGVPNYDTSIVGYTYNPSKAKELLLSQGYSMSKKVSIELHINNSFIEMAELIAYQLEQVGFDVEIKLHTPDIMMQMAKDGQAPFFRRSWIGDYPDPETYYACFYSKNSAPPNYTRFSNVEYDKYYEKSLSEINPELRRTYYSAMDRLLLEASPFVALYYDQSIRMSQINIQNIQQNALNTLDLRRVKKRN